MATLRLSSFTYELLASVKSKPLFDIWRHISDFRDSGHKLGWTLETRDCLRGRGHRLALGCLSALIFTLPVSGEIVVFVSEGSVTAARSDAFGIYLVSCVI